MSNLDDLYRASREASNAYASLDAPDLPEDPWSALQVRLFRWERRAYGLQPMSSPALGVIEEMGELTEALTQEEAEDAVADIVVFATQLCTLNRLDIGVMICGLAPSCGDDYEHRAIDRSSQAGRLAHVTLKSSQRIRGLATPETQRRAVFDALMPILDNAIVELDCLYDNAEAWLALVTGVAEQVMARDKAKLPATVAVRT